jgi:hypothetical protein
MDGSGLCLYTDLPEEDINAQIRNNTIEQREKDSSNISWSTKNHLVYNYDTG